MFSVCLFDKVPSELASDDVLEAATVLSRCFRLKMLSMISSQARASDIAEKASPKRFQDIKVRSLAW